MQKLRRNKILTLVLAALCAMFGVAVLSGVRREQAPIRENKLVVASAAQPLAVLPLIADKIAVPAQTPATVSIYAAAAKQNRELKFNMIWAFGGRAQRGWHLYESLICELLAAPRADGEDFAASLARWQQTTNLPAHGILNEPTFAAIIKTWQSNRLKVRGYPSPDELVTAPAADFWDSSRAADLRMVERETLAAYQKMVRAAAADKSLRLQTNADGSLAENEKFLKIVSAFRSKEHQARLRAASPNSGRAGLAVNSPHFTGRALDLYVGGEPVETRDDNRAVQINTPVYKWLVKNARKFGFKPYFYEPWHWEYAPDDETTNVKPEPVSNRETRETR